MAAGVFFDFWVYKNNGEGVFTLFDSNVLGGGEKHSLHLADLDRDHDLDVVVMNSNKLRWGENDGAGNFESHDISTTGGMGALFVEAADLDGDHEFDLFRPASRVEWYANDGQEEFSNRVLEDFGPAIAVHGDIGDIDSDGDLDLVTAFDDGRIVWYENEPANKGDFNSDGVYDGLDIDQLMQGILEGDHEPALELTGDGVVDLQDRDQWLIEAGAANLPSQNLYLLGDANLDGFVDGLDFVIWNENKFQDVNGWTAGDFNADGYVDGLDFIIWNQFKFQSSFDFPAPAPRGPMALDGINDALSHPVDDEGVSSSSGAADSPMANEVKAIRECVFRRLAIGARSTQFDLSSSRFDLEN